MERKKHHVGAQSRASAPATLRTVAWGRDSQPGSESRGTLGTRTCLLGHSVCPALLLLLLSRLSRVRLCATPQTAAHQAPLSLGFSRQDHWSGLPLPSPWNFIVLGKYCPVGMWTQNLHTLPFLREAPNLNFYFLNFIIFKTPCECSVMSNSLQPHGL